MGQTKNREKEERSVASSRGEDVQQENNSPSCRLLSLHLRAIPALSAERYALKDPSQVYNLNGILHVNQSKGSQEAKDEATLETIVNHLEKSYCGKIAYEFTHIPVRTHPSCMRSKESRSEKRLSPTKTCFSLKN